MLQQVRSRDEWQDNDVELLFDYVDTRAGATDAVVRAAILQNWRSFDHNNPEDLEEFYNYAVTTLSLTPIGSLQAFLRTIPKRQNSTRDTIIAILDFFDSGLAINTAALTLGDYENILPALTIVTAAIGGTDDLGQAITDLAQGGGRVDDGTFMSLKPGYGWHLRQTTPPSPGNRIELSPSFVATGDWTLEAWMNSGEDNGNARVILFGQNDNIAAETKVVEYIFHPDALAVQVEIDDENGVSIWSSGTVAIADPGTDVWKHCAVTFDSVNGQYNVFYDGNRIAQSPTSTAATDPFDAVGHFNGTPADEGGWTETRLSRVLRYNAATYTVPVAPFVID